MKRFPLIALVFTFILSACGPSPEQQATMTATAATATAAGWTKTPTPTSTPTNTPTPTSTNTPTPTPTPVGGSGRLVLGINRYDTSSSSNIPGVYLYDLSTHKATLLFEGFSLWGRVSPDGNKLLVSRQIQGQNNSQELYAVDLNGSNSTLLYRYVFNQFAPIWLPGTNWIAFLAFINQKVQVFVIHPDGTGLTQVTQSTIGVGEILSAYDGGIYWEEALSTRSGYYSHGYRWTKIDGSETKKLDDWRNPAISFDGRYIAYVDSNPCQIEGVYMLGCSLTISKLDGSNSTTISIDTLQLPKADFVSFSGVVWLPNDLGVLAKIGLCNEGETCTSKFVIFSAEGTFLKEFLEAVLPGVFPGEMSWFLWLDGDWSPDNRLFIYERPDKFELGKALQTTPMIFDLETMNAEILEITLDEGLVVKRMYWLPNGE